VVPVDAVAGAGCSGGGHARFTFRAKRSGGVVFADSNNGATASAGRSSRASTNPATCANAISPAANNSATPGNDPSQSATAACVRRVAQRHHRPEPRLGAPASAHRLGQHHQLPRIDLRPRHLQRRDRVAQIGVGPVAQPVGSDVSVHLHEHVFECTDRV
jgi:hypothetical protein